MTIKTMTTRVKVAITIIPSLLVFAHCLFFGFNMSSLLFGVSVGISISTLLDILVQQKIKKRGDDE